ncbi:MAG: response regulator transcription factor [Methylotetracoccus sp.]|nr:response regulator transcription factor [Methylotetracoccus sp.]
MPRKIRLLVVEDEPAIRSGLADVLLFHGYEVDTATEGPEGLAKALSGKFDLVLLDIMLPKMDGLEICDRIRRSDPDQPIILLTARNTDDDVVRGLALGADDYVAKPFSVAQLVLRVQAVLRRSQIGVDLATTIELGADIRIDTRNLAGTRGQEVLAFTRKEIQVLQYLHAHHARAVPREELLAKVWGYGKDLELETRTVDIHVAKLRRKIEPDPSNPKYLVTIRGAGYRLLIT